MTPRQQPLETMVYGDFADLLKPDSKWMIGGFPGWEFREPDAVVVVQNGRLRVAAMPLTRGNAMVQILDNAKHMYFSQGDSSRCRRAARFPSSSRSARRNERHRATTSTTASSP